MWPSEDLVSGCLYVLVQVVIVVMWLALWGGLFYVLFHFAAKYW
jgi:hypothetical protein